MRPFRWEAQNIVSGFLLVLLYFCAIVSLVWILRQLVKWCRRLPGEDRHGERLADAGGLVYRAHAPSVDCSRAPLRVLRQRVVVAGEWSGRIEGISVRVVETLPRDVSGQQRCRRQPVVLIDIPKASWPVFEIHPRGPALWLWLLLGCPGLRFRWKPDQPAPRSRRKIVQRFNRRYFVVLGLTRRIAELAGFDAGIPLGLSVRDDAEIGDRFCWHTLQQFAATSGWHVECCGTQIAFWRGGFWRSSQEPIPLLRQAVPLYRSLESPAREPADLQVEVEINDLDHAQLHGRLIGLAAGALLAMGLLMLISLPVLSLIPPESLAWVLCLWPLLSVGCLAAGAYLGGRWAALRDHRY